MDATYYYLLVLIVAVVVAMLALARLITRPSPGLAARQGASESPIAASTEGMKMCPKCTMGNLWTERRCSACGASLKG